MSVRSSAPDSADGEWSTVPSISPAVAARTPPSDGSNRSRVAIDRVKLADAWLPRAVAPALQLRTSARAAISAMSPAYPGPRGRRPARSGCDHRAARRRADYLRPRSGSQIEPSRRMSAANPYRATAAIPDPNGRRPTPDETPGASTTPPASLSVVIAALRASVFARSPRRSGDRSGGARRIAAP